MAPGKKDGKKPMQQPDKDEETKKRVLEMLEEMPDTVPGSKKFKSATKKLEFSIAFTKHQSTGQCSFKNLLLMFAILAKDKDGVPKGPDPFGIPCESGIWYDIKERKNLAKVSTPEVGAAIIEKIKGSCSESAPLMEGSCSAPDGFEAPVIRIVKVDQLEVNGEMQDNMMFFIGKMFTIKEQLKVRFDIKYGEMLFQGAQKTAWHAKITEATEDATKGIEAWLTSFGWDVEVIDLRIN
jgi:hypothetical protein